MSRFAGATVFSKLDASSGFWQLNLDNESSDLCTFNTQFGRYRYSRLPFGISSAPEIYHRTIHQMVEHVDGVDTFLGDTISVDGIKADQRKIQAINNMENQPTERNYNVFLGW
jgi:hypothetical protein